MTYDEIKANAANLTTKELIGRRDYFNECASVARDREFNNLIEQASAMEAEGLPVKSLLREFIYGEPKYRDPVTGNTWTGRGKKPRWLTDQLDAGKSLDDFKA